MILDAHGKPIRKLLNLLTPDWLTADLLREAENLRKFATTVKIDELRQSLGVEPEWREGATVTVRLPTRWKG